LNDGLGEYFQFKNPDYQEGINPHIERLKFGLNDWQFSDTGNVAGQPTGALRNITNFMRVISPARFGPTAIWTGEFATEARLSRYGQTPRNFMDVSGNAEMTSGLLGWWDMEVEEGGIISPENSHPLDPLLILKANNANDSIYRFSRTSEETLTDFVDLPKQNVVLPFGGFPGTEQYG
jgi:hypothetical protein